MYNVYYFTKRLNNSGNPSTRSRRSVGKLKHGSTKLSYNKLILLVRSIFESNSSDLCQHKQLCNLAEMVIIDKQGKLEIFK